MQDAQKGATAPKVTEIHREADSDEGDAFDRLIRKTYDRDCEKFFQRIHKLKR